MGLLDLLSDSNNRLNLGASMLMNNNTDDFWKNTGMGLGGYFKGDMERQLAELERQKLEASMKTNDMKNWEYGKTNPEFNDFMRTQGSSAQPTAQMKNWMFREALIKKHNGNANHPEVVQFDNWVRAHKWNDFGTYYGLMNPNLPGSLYKPSQPMSGNQPQPLPPGMNPDLSTPEGVAQAQAYMSGQNGQTPPRGPNNVPYSSNIPRGTVPKDIYGKKRQEEQAKIDVGKESKANSEIMNLDMALSTINELKTHPGREAATGMSSYIPSRRGGDSYGFETLHDQAKDQTFVRVREILKGAGAVTDFEGSKAESAFNRLDLGLKESEYLKVLNQLADQIRIAKRHISKYLSEGGDPSLIFGAGGDPEGFSIEEIPSGN